MNNKGKDIGGKKFGRLTVIEFAGKKYRKNLWRCRCECGKETITTASHLLSGHTKSCGCLAKEKSIIASKIANAKHGMRKTVIYRIWANMKARCLNPKDQHYYAYGKRGIKVCDRWVNSFQNFMVDMGLPPKGTSLDRIDVNGDYCPENCRWANNKIQANNRRNTIYLEFKGVIKPLAIWADELKINPDTLACRIFRSGWSIEKAFTTPIRKRRVA